MKLNFKKYWRVYFFVTSFSIMIGYVVYCEYHILYLLEFNGSVVAKNRPLPKKLPRITVSGTDEPFRLSKWKGMKYADILLGDSVVKRKYESEVVWYSKQKDGTFTVTRLKYWIW